MSIRGSRAKTEFYILFLILFLVFFARSILLATDSWKTSSIEANSQVKSPGRASEKVAPPEFKPLPGSFDKPVDLILSCSTPEATIFYTTDGTNPLTSSSRRQFRRRLLISFTSVIKAVAMKEGFEPSEVVEAQFFIRVAPPEAWPGAGEWRELPETITLSCSTPQATIFYTLDGSEPNRNSLKYKEPIKLVKDRVNVIKAIAVKDDGSPDSFIATFPFRVNPDLVMLTDVLKPGSNIQEIVSKLVNEMTLEEKVRLVWGAGNSPIGAAGNTYPIPRLGIVSLELADGPAGVRLNDRYATCWPNPLTLASTWNTELLEQIGTAVGREACYFGVDIMLSPGMNIHRDPLGGRVFEYYSEDPYLTGKMAAAYIRGLENQGIGATMKHYAANNFENNRANIDEVISERALREIYLRPWELAIKEASPWAVMTAYNKVNGEWCAENKYLLEALREFGFSGLVMSDWGGYHNPIAYARGFDLNMPGRTGWESLIEAIKNKVISEENLNQAVTDILKIIIRTKTFKNQIYDKSAFVAKKQLNEELKAAHKILATQSEAEGIVLLKNADETLPLKNISRVALIGSSAVPELKTIVSSPAKGIIYEGGGSAKVNVDPNDIVSLASALEQAGFSVLQKNAVHSYFQEGLSEADAVYAAQNSEAALILISRPGQEGMDNTSMDLTEKEKDMIQKISEAFHRERKKVVVLLNVAYPIVVDWDDYVDAIVYVGLPGTYGALAVADMLKGTVNPSGKLVDTWPKSYSLAPTYGNMPKFDQPSIVYKEDIFIGYRYYDQHPEAVRYPFGYGLSYTTFSYRNMRLNKTEINFSRPDELVVVSIDVENTGNVAGKEVAQLYVKPIASKGKRPLKELKGFAKTRLLEPGEQEQLTFVLAYRDFAYWNEKARNWTVDPGIYEIIIGGTSDEASLKTTGQSSRVKIVK
ncbi:MAG: glycoside hydrolase family 3 C-terminal domain-containing protein [Candidatus Aminicenantes bacterium]|nr:glycoside hydrolase family 3 C-terminal domain-containing protein [Candidatus Aminicenantes bacterium]